MPSVECSVCSEEFGKSKDESTIATSCGHVFHESCLSKWLQNCYSTAEVQTCPECREPVVMSHTRRIYFHANTVTDNLQSYVDYLDTVIATKSDKLHSATMELEKLKLDWKKKIREKDFEIQRLNDKLKKRDSDSEAQRLHSKCERLKHKLKELKQVHAECAKKQHFTQQTNVNINENGSPYVQLNYIPIANPIVNPMQTQNVVRDRSIQIYGPMPSIATLPSLPQSMPSVSTSTTSIANSSRSNFRNPLSIFPGTVQITNYPQHSTQPYQENFYPPNQYNHSFFNTNNQSQYY